MAKIPKAETIEVCWHSPHQISKTDLSVALFLRAMFKKDLAYFQVFVTIKIQLGNQGRFKMGFLNGLVKRKAHTRKVGTKTVKVKAATKGSITTSRHKKATTKKR